VRSICLVAAFVVAGCQGGTSTPRDARVEPTPPRAPDVTLEDRLAPPPPDSAALPFQAQGSYDRARKAVDQLQAGTTNPARPCGVLAAARNIPELAKGTATAEIDAALAPGERLCERDAWLAAARAGLDVVAAGDPRGCGAATVALARVAEARVNDAETVEVAARLRAACP
jgi:hypothetical protein